MKEYCISFVSGDETGNLVEYYHTHVFAHDVENALEGAMLNAAIANVDLQKVRAVSASTMLATTDQWHAAYENLRVPLQQGRQSKEASTAAPHTTCLH